MDSHTGNDPLRGVDDIAWRERVPGWGASIPGLLRGLYSEEDPLESALALGEILNYPRPGHVAAPQVVEFLVELACDPTTPSPYHVLTLLHEFAAGAPGDHIPRRRDLAMWRDEVAWVTSVGREEALAQYRQWRDEAGDEQQYRRMRTQIRALEQENGTAVLASELAVYEAISSRVDDLLRLVTDRDLRMGEFVPQEAANLLGLFPEHAEKTIPALRALERATFVAPEDFASALFAIGTLADPADPGIVTYLTKQMLPKPSLLDSESVRFSAAMALIHLLGENAPAHACQAVLPHLSSPEMYELFPSPYADIGNNTFVILTAGLAGEQTRAGRIAAYATLFEEQGERMDSSLLVADALELAFGPRTAPRAKAGHDSFDGYDTDQQEVLWAITELSAAAWERCDVAATLAAWGLPGERHDFLVFTGAEVAEPPETRKGASAIAGGAERPEREQALSGGDSEVEGAGGGGE